MSLLRKLLTKIDGYQRKHGILGLPYAVIKKYGDDETGYQAALLTYYGFLSLFPLILVLTTVVGLVAGNHPHLSDTIISHTTQYFPTLGNQLSEHIGTLHKSGVALLVGILFTLYGARGIADAFRHGVNHIWQVPKVKRASFPVSAARSLAIVVLGGIGFIGASVITGFASSAGKGAGFVILSLLINFIILFWVFLLLIKVSLPVHITFRDIDVGAAAAAFGLVILQLVGVNLLKHEVKSLSALYSNFAIPLSLLFWIYLQSQIVYYSVELASVRAKGLWPRSLTGKDLTDADRLVYARQAKKERMVEEESVTADFRS